MRVFPGGGEPTEHNVAGTTELDILMFPDGNNVELVNHNRG
jgi:hypothetical protein